MKVRKWKKCSPSASKEYDNAAWLKSDFWKIDQRLFFQIHIKYPGMDNCQNTI